MESHLAWFTLFSLLLLANCAEARKDPGEYWSSIMKEQPMPEAIQGLLHQDSSPSQLNKDANCHTAMEARNKDHQHVEDLINTKIEKPFVKDFEPRPNVSAYNDDDAGHETEEKFVKDFEPRPNVSAYNDNDKPKEEKQPEFEPAPDTTIYHE
ncbi:Organ-specific protein S2 [Morella rubra]|uniref:Organ-specific protein S2 n=1 Tax=Morella rubra TaxID=262757 RepID=A0A6A1V3H0_9ROSI|nr:Organ-specific protein S2 [Morella rubra]